MQVLFEELGIEDILTKHPRFYNKFSRAHIKSNLVNDEKMLFIDGHYRFMTENFNKRSLKEFYHNYALLYDFTPDNIDLVVNISYMTFLQREGEIMLNLLKKDGTRVYSTAGTFYNNSFYISAIQGCKDFELIREYTKECYGMRPHNLLFFALLSFLKSLNMQHLFAITNENQIFNEKKTKKNVLFYYKDFFMDIYTKEPVQKDGWFVLDLMYPLKHIEDIKSKKRSMYKKRYTLLNSIDNGIESNLKLFKI
jgi:uncharacterized protein VirK/YbjX